MEVAKEQDMQVEAAVNTEAAAHGLEDGEHVEKEEDAKLEAGEKDETVVPAVMTDIEKKKKRAERFGTDLKISEAEKRKMRAARFNDGTKNGATAVAAAPVEVKGGSDMKVAVPETVKAALMEAESLKRKARAERFGSVQPEAVLKPKFSKDDVAPKAKLPDDEEAKKKARMARFAMTAK